MPEQLFPLIKEVHGKTYAKGTEIYPLATEYSVERSKEKKIASIRADITVVVDKKDIYHFECQMDYDGTMVIRMFEYDVHMALSYIEQTESGMSLKFPHSAVLYLQDNGNIPDELKCKIKFQDGGTYEYRVPVIKVATYTLEEIKEKHLCVLIPFLPLRFRKNLKTIQRQKEETRKAELVTKQKEELTSLYQQIILFLEEEVASGYLSDTNRKTILSLLNKSMIRVFYRNDTLLREVVEMTEPILELEFEKAERYKRELEEKTAEYEKEMLEKSEEYEKTIAELKKQVEGTTEGRTRMIADFFRNGGTEEQAKQLLNASENEIFAARERLTVNV